MPRALLSMMGWLLCAQAGAADLAFATTAVEITPAPDATAVDAHFPFTNTSTHAVTITDIVAACGCTTATSDKRAYQPGEAGSVDLTFTFGDRSGPQTKVVRVDSSASGSAPESLALTLKVDLPVGPVITPSISYWPVGAPPERRLILIDLPPGCPFTPTAARCTDAGIPVALERAADGKGYAIAVQPPLSVGFRWAVVDIETDLHRTFHAYLSIGTDK